MTTEKLKTHLGNIKVIDSITEREMYSHDIGDLPPFMMKLLFRNMPDLVAQPRTIEEIQKILV